MSKGKYSPSLTRKMIDGESAYIYNADGQIPPSVTPDLKYDTRRDFPNYDQEGYDSYGYSAFDSDGNYVGIGDGVDRWGYTEMDYLLMSDEEFLSLNP